MSIYLILLKHDNLSSLHFSRAMLMTYNAVLKSDFNYQINSGLNATTLTLSNL